MKLVYFAWVRERIGKAEEEIVLPGSVKTVADLLDHEFAGMGGPNLIRVAINQEHADHHEPIAGAREIALFPPMTGG